MATYPQALLNWTTRVNSQTIYAADPNTLAAEIDAIEAAVGILPMNESGALTDAVSTFASLSARVTAASLSQGHPYVEIKYPQFQVPHRTGTGLAFNPGGAPASTSGGKGVYFAHYYNTNGTFTVKDSGVWLINANIIWDSAPTGWVQHALYFGNDIVRRGFFNYSMFPQSGSNSFGERFINQWGMTESTFVGRVPSGTLVRVGTANYTSRNPLAVESGSLSAFYLRS